MTTGFADNLYVLLADDDADDRMLFDEAITETGISVKLAMVKDGQQLLDFLESSIILPHILFLDLNMPIRDGMQCLQDIRKHVKYNALCVCMYSTTARQADIEQSSALGANLFINKPNSFTELKLLLKKVLTMDPKECFAVEKEKFVFKA